LRVRGVGAGERAGASPCARVGKGEGGRRQGERMVGTRHQLRWWKAAEPGPSPRRASTHRAITYAPCSVKTDILRLDGFGVVCGPPFVTAVPLVPNWLVTCVYSAVSPPPGGKVRPRPSSRRPIASRAAPRRGPRLRQCPPTPRGGRSLGPWQGYPPFWFRTTAGLPRPPEVVTGAVGSFAWVLVRPKL